MCSDDTNDTCHKHLCFYKLSALSAAILQALQSMLNAGARRTSWEVHNVISPDFYGEYQNYTFFETLSYMQPEKQCFHLPSRYQYKSATHGDLLVPRTRTVTYGPRSFSVSGPTVWNTLPSTLRVSATTLGQFQSGLKTILFRLVYGTWLGAFVNV